MFIVSSCNKEGCTDPLATNYNAEAKKDDGSCLLLDGGITKLDCRLFEQSGTSYTLIDKGLPVDYIVDCQMVVNGDLIIMPGVCIEFLADAGFAIYEDGSIQAVSTSDAPIKFTGLDKIRGAWSGIYIESTDVKNKLDGVIIEYAGGSAFNSNDDRGAVIIYGGTKAKVENCSISNSAAYGINATYHDCDILLNNNIITTCLKPIYTNANYIGSISGGAYTGNDQDVVYIDTYDGGGIYNAATWNNLEIPYQVKTGGSLQVIDVNLTILPGVIIKFETGTALKIQDNSSLKALGTASNPIRFTGVDGLPGSWENIEFNFTQSALNEIGHAIIEFSGAPDAKGAISMWANPKINVHDVVFRQITTCAFYDAPKSSPGSQSVNPNLTSTNNTYETIGNQYNEDTDPANSSYCFGW